jgi:hypothetical protein
LRPEVGPPVEEMAWRKNSWAFANSENFFAGFQGTKKRDIWRERKTRDKCLAKQFPKFDFDPKQITKFANIEVLILISNKKRRRGFIKTIRA